MNNGSTHVLLIEDNPGDADLVRLRLVEAHSDIAVSCATRLSTGLASLVVETPAMVLLDLNLPDSHGAETYRKVLEAAPGVPIVVLSGLDDEEIAVSAVHQGVQDYLVKGSFDSKQLARAMRYAIERQALLTSLDMSRRQQLQFKNEFLSHVSHELRTPLTCIHQFVSLILDGLAGKVIPEQREHLETVFRSVNQLRAMITDLLEATRAESGKITIEPRCVVIGDLIRQAVAMLQSTAQAKGIGLEAGIDTRIPFVYADANRVLQVLTNLVENAIKFTPADGSVMVKACLTEGNPDFVQVSVADTGRGISPEAKALIFERLYQDPNSVDDSRKGLGLGLYISKELVRLHGGQIWVESQLSHGSTLVFTLPLFSLTKLLTPILTHLGRLRESISLITLEVTPLLNFTGNWEETRQHCLTLLEPCVLGDKDAILPALGQTGPGETLVIVVSTDEHGATVVERRIRDQLERSERLGASCTFKLSSVGLKLPAADRLEPVDKLVQEVADGITAMAMTALQRRKSPLN
ncbi:MAG: hybrid sensor histidine kinase/response regulator [Acidobacteriia bacterium]|nr:hybrid sensor histidine kinase/response regulator [Terriglobia bacterium]